MVDGWRSKTYYDSRKVSQIYYFGYQPLLTWSISVRQDTPAWVTVLCKSGVQIDIEKVDFTNQSELYQLKERFPEIAGVVYGGNLSVQETDYDLSHTIFKSVANLDKIFTETHLDFFILLTPFSQTLDGPGELETTAVGL